MGQLDGKVAVITGASRGFGLAIAEVYAREGAVVVLAARSAEALKLAAADLNAHGLRALAQPCDVGDLEQVEALADHAVQTFGKIDIWVNNAAMAGVYGPTAHLPVERFESVIRTNINGVYYGSVVALRHFLPRRSGKLINMLGRGADKPVKYQNAYTSSKAWVKSFTLALAQEYKDSGIGIFALNPGLMNTGLLRQIDALEGYEQKLAPLSTVIRLWANPPEVPAQKALWLASSATDGKTGLTVSMMGPVALASGLIRELGRRLRGQPGPDASLHISTVKSPLKS